MSQTLWPVAVRTVDLNTGARTRRVVGLLCSIGYFCSVFVESVVSTVNGDSSPARQLEYIVSHLDTIRVQVYFELLSPLFLLGMVFAIVGAIRFRGVWMAGAAAVLGVFGALAMTVGASVHLVVLLLVDAGAPKGAIEAVLSVQLPDALFFLFFAAPMALLLLAAAAWRARVVTWIAFAAVVVYVALDVAAILPEVVPLAIGLVAFAVIGWGLVRAPAKDLSASVRPPIKSTGDSARV